MPCRRRRRVAVRLMPASALHARAVLARHRRASRRCRSPRLRQPPQPVVARVAPAHVRVDCPARRRASTRDQGALGHRRCTGRPSRLRGHQRRRARLGAAAVAPSARPQQQRPPVAPAPAYHGRRAGPTVPTAGLSPEQDRADQPVVAGSRSRRTCPGPGRRSVTTSVVRPAAHRAPIAARSTPAALSRVTTGRGRVAGSGPRRSARRRAPRPAPSPARPAR